MQPENKLRGFDSPLTQKGAGANPAGTAAGPNRLWGVFSAVRFQEVCILQGAPFMGLLYSFGRFSAAKAAPLALFVPASFLLVAHVWTLNDWADTGTDRRDPNRKDAAGRWESGHSRDILLFSLSLLALSLALFALLPPRTLEAAMVIAALGAYYSLPLFRLKGVPLAASVVHFVGGLFHFLLGYSLYSPIDRDGVRLAVFFAIIFTAGHAIQEVQDWESDKRSGIWTAAVRYGRTPVFVAAVAGFVAGYLYLYYLAHCNAIASWLGWLVPPLIFLQLHWSVQAFRGGLGFQTMARLRHLYRILFAAVGILMAIAVVG
jgi:4-hydroxybenzoate polyprenyltransferase